MTYQYMKKITSEINKSDALVAIITSGSCSASVHQEIGYAIAKDISVIVMLEEGADDGVLSYGRDKEIFAKESFEAHSKKVLEYLSTSKSRMSTSVESAEFLQGRKLTQTNAPDFGTGGNAGHLKNSLVRYDLPGNPAVLFSVIPTRLLDDIPVNA